MNHFRRTRILRLILPICLVACGEVASVGDAPDAPDASAPSTGASDAAGGRSDTSAAPEGDSGADATTASTGADAAADAPVAPDALDAGVDTSCLDVHQRDPAAPSGVYPIVVGGQSLDVYCDMTLGQGGWTAFYAGTLGARNVFAHFDRGGLAGNPPDDCGDPANRCLRHLPSAVTVANGFAVACGPNAVSFSATAELLTYLHAGTPGSWLPLGAPTALTPSAHAEWATYFWTGGQDPQGVSDGNLGWIVSNGASPTDSNQEHTFASAYDSRSWGWDYCNGTDYNGDASAPAGGTPGPTVRLFYR